MKVRKFVPVVFLLSLLVSITTPPYGKTVQAETRICETDGNFEPRSSVYRTVELLDIGITIDIPNNYRAMRRQDGSVLVLHPDNYRVFQCIANGGRGGGGFYAEEIRLVDRDFSRSLIDQALEIGGYDDGGSRHERSRVIDYDQPILAGYVVTSNWGYSVTFVGLIEGQQEKVLVVSAACDCLVKVEDVTNLLNRVQLIH